MLHLKWQDCEIISSELGPRKEHGSSLTLLCLHLILPNCYKTSSSKEEADLLHQNNSARKRTNVLCILPWKYELNIDALRVPLFALLLQSAASECSHSLPCFPTTYTPVTPNHLPSTCLHLDILRSPDCQTLQPVQFLHPYSPKLCVVLSFLKSPSIG